MLIKTVNFNDFLEEFEKYGREDQFTYEGKEALFNYLNELGEDLGESIELDVIAICCDFTEYGCLEEFNDAYNYAVGEVNSIDDICGYTVVIPIDEESFIIQNF